MQKKNVIKNGTTIIFCSDFDKNFLAYVSEKNCRKINISRKRNWDKNSKSQKLEMKMLSNEKFIKIFFFCIGFKTLRILWEKKMCPLSERGEGDLHVTLIGQGPQQAISLISLYSYTLFVLVTIKIYIDTYIKRHIYTYIEEIFS